MKRGIVKFILMAMLLSTTIGVAQAREFSDMNPTHWAYKEIQSLANGNIVVGYPDGTFNPDAPATRAEFATMVIKALRQGHAQPAEMFYFSDLTKDHWAYNMIQRACAFDLIKGFPDDTFKPEENISKAEAIAIIVSAVNTDKITEAQAKAALKAYTDADKIPDWAIIPAGKSEKLGVTAHNPMTYNLFEPDKKITRAEVAANLYNMREEVKINPNAKLTPKKADGLVIDQATVDGTVAVIPAGTLIPATLLTALSSQVDEAGKVFTAEVKQNLVTKEKYLLVPQGTVISGELVKVKPGRYFIRNAKMHLDTRYISLAYKQKSNFPGNINAKHKQSKGFWKLVSFILKGKKLNFVEGDGVNIELAQPVTVDLLSTTILN